MKKINWIMLILFVVFTELVGYLSSILAGNIPETYAELIKPPLAPPSGVFGIVWIVLYALMGIAAYLIYRSEEGLIRKQSLVLFGIQLCLNFIWTIVFFGFNMYWAAVIVIILLDLAVLFTIMSFLRVNKTAGWLLVPYFIWILFATYLNIGIAILN